MKQQNKQVNNIAELNSLFATLNDANQEYALILLHTLRFSQTHSKSEKQSESDSR